MADHNATEAPRSAPEAVYVFGIVRAEEAEGLDVSGIGVQPSRLRPVRHRDLAALVTEVAADVLEASRDDVVGHARVLEQVVEHATVLPMRFGMTMERQEAVIDDLLRPGYERWEALLDKLDDAVELQVKAFEDADAMLRRAVEADPRIRALRGATSLNERVRLGELVAGALAKQRKGEADRLMERLRPLARATSEGTPAIEGMIVNAAFLVDREEVAHFDAEVAQLGQDVADRLRVRCLGPQPPYTFVTEPEVA
jgi:hypothetical protein